MAPLFLLRSLLKSFFVGLAVAIVLGAAALALARFDAFVIFLAPAWLIVPVLGPLIPSRLIDWLLPNGGAPAGFLVILASAMLFWTFLSGGVYFALRCRAKQKGAVQSANS